MISGGTTRCCCRVSCSSVQCVGGNYRLHKAKKGIRTASDQQPVHGLQIGRTKHRVGTYESSYLSGHLAGVLTEDETDFCLQAVDQMLAGEDVTMLASMLKLKTGRLAREITDSCLQFWGGMGFTNEVMVSRLYRDLRLWSIGGGADEVMLGIICKMMDILPKVEKK